LACCNQQGAFGDGKGFSVLQGVSKMALGIGHINELFAPGHPVADLRKVAEQLRAQSATNEAAKALLEALEQDFPELKEEQTSPQPRERKVA
jgi:hypothetical protein